MSNKPNNKATSVVYDASGLLKELNTTKPFSLGGEQFDLPGPEAWSDEVHEAALRNDIVAAARHILGDADYERFKAAGGNALLLQRVVVEVHGASMGESAGSSPS